MNDRIIQNLMCKLPATAIVMYLATFCILLYQAKFRLDLFNFKFFLGATGGLIGLLGFLAERYEKMIETRVNLQTEFYKQWNELRKEIRKLKETEDEIEGEEKFIEYFQFLNHEYDMKEHLSLQISRLYETYRKNEFQDNARYANKTHREWWNIIKGQTLTEEFKEYINNKILGNPCS